MAKVKTVYAAGRTGFSLNDASSISLGVRNNSPHDFSIGEHWENKINLSSVLDKVLKSNNYETVVGSSFSELSQDNCLLYNSQDLKLIDEANKHQLPSETDGLGENTENCCLELTIDTPVLMAPITEAYKTVHSDVSTSDSIYNDFMLLQSVESSPENNELPQKTDFNHVSNVSDISDWTAASSSPPKSNTNSRSNYVSFPKCEQDTFKNELLSLIENGDTQEKCIENISNSSAGNSMSPVSANSNIDNFCGKSLSELAECHLKLDELSQTSNNSSSDIDFNVPPLLLNTAECRIFDAHCEPVSNCLLETSSPESNTLSSRSPVLRENKSVNYENKNVENDSEFQTKLCNSDLMPTKDNVNIDSNASVTESLKSIYDSNTVDALMPESSCSIKLNCESFLDTKNDRDVHKSNDSLKSANINSESLSGSSFFNSDNLLNCELPYATKSEDVQLSGSGLKLHNESDSLVPQTSNFSTSNTCDTSVNKIYNDLFDKSCHVEDSSVDADFFLKDILSNVGNNGISIMNSKPLNGESNLFDLLLSEGKKVKELESELPVVTQDFDNLSILLNSSVVQPSCSLSLADLANSHLFNDVPDKSRNDTDKNRPDVRNNFNHNSSSFGNFQSNLPEKQSEAVFDIEENFLNKSNNEATKIKDVEEKQQFKDNLTRNALEDEIELDIDLNFCVRSPVIKDNYFAESSNSESRDSGFDETDLATIKSIIPSFKVSASSKKEENEISENFLSKKRPSLLSIAISCKLNIERSRQEKLNKVRKELLKHSFPAAFVNINLEDDSQSVEKSRNNTDKNVCNRKKLTADISEDCEELCNHMVFLGQ